MKSLMQNSYPKEGIEQPRHPHKIIDALITLILFGYIYLFSYYVGGHFIYGDQLLYRELYSILSESSFVESFIIYRSRIHSNDILHFVFSWLFSRFFDKDVVMSFLNAILGSLAYRLFLKWGAARSIAVLVVCTNVYFISLYLSAERLKLSFIFVALFFLTLERRTFLPAGSAILAFIAHGQTLVFFASAATNSVYKKISYVFRSARVRRSDLLKSFVILTVATTLAVIFGSNLIAKAKFYFMASEPTGILKTLPFVAGALICARSKASAIASLTFPVLVVGFLGSDRFLIMLYFVFLYYAVQRNMGINLFVLLSSIYYGFSAFVYTTNVITYGVNTSLP